MQYTSNSQQETQEMGEKIAQTLCGGDIVLLKGDLGAGKTTLTKGIAEGLGVDSNDIVSPTFTLMQTYPLKDKQILVHIDTYRLEHEDQLVAIGVEDYIGAEDTITIIEWPEKLTSLLSDMRTKTITLKQTGDETREVSIEDQK